MEKMAIELKIHLELRRAREKHPEWPEDIIHQAAILAEEAGETLKAANDYKYNGVSWPETRERIVKEAVQTGAMVMRLLENLPGKLWMEVPPVAIVEKDLGAKKIQRMLQNHPI